MKAVGSLALDQIDLDRAEAAAREGLELSVEVETGGKLAASFRRILAVVAGVRGDNERADELLGESLVLSRKADDKLEMAEVLLNLGNNASLMSDDGRAKELYAEGIAVCREMGYARKLGDLLLSLGYQLLIEGEIERGEPLIEESAALFRQGGYKGHLEFALDNLGWAALLKGDPERAGTYYRESLTLCKELGNAMTAAEALEGLACVFVAEGAYERAARLFGSGEILRGEVGPLHTPADDALREPYLKDARARLDSATWEAAFVEGQAKGLDEAIDYALSARLPSTPPVPSPDTSRVRVATLTRREEEIADLVARGMTNRQIAAELTLSRHTVANHVARILSKLGVDSRSHITAWVVERRTMR